MAHIPTDVINLVSQYSGYVPARVARAWNDALHQYHNIDTIIQTYDTLQDIIKYGTKAELQIAVQHLSNIPYDIDEVVSAALDIGNVELLVKIESILGIHMLEDMLSEIVEDVLADEDGGYDLPLLKSILRHRPDLADKVLIHIHIDHVSLIYVDNVYELIQYIHSLGIPIKTPGIIDRIIECDNPTEEIMPLIELLISLGVVPDSSTFTSAARSLRVDVLKHIIPYIGDMNAISTISTIHDAICGTGDEYDMDYVDRLDETILYLKSIGTLPYGDADVDKAISSFGELSEIYIGRHLDAESTPNEVIVWWLRSYEPSNE